MSQESENIQVVVRCRGRNLKETNSKSTVVVHVDNEEGEEVLLNPSDEVGLQAQLNSKVYKFNKVYGPMADQDIIFKGVASPMFDEFLKGYNCTLLVYGMTSSGKTYTMTGNTASQDTQLNQEAGIIPRVLVKLFNVLNDSNNNNDYIVKCSFVELYNEELKDLLSDDQNKKLRIYDQKQNSNTNFITNPFQLNKSAIHIQNLEEIIVKDAKHGLRTLQKGLKLRQVAATKMNDVSSRSHTIFTLNLFRQNKESGELFRISKMNLVDLAGSENISRSGALNQRAKEAGSINQSLLTLGRVINLLVDKSETSSTHIPFRESKLTRLLQDSLGGRTKTCLIATISPAKINYDETLSTLEYANKAKSIQNKPQLGSTLSKDILLKDLVIELSKAKSDLSANKSKEGIYMDNSNYDEIMNDIQEYKTEVQENIRKQEQLKKQNEFYKNKLATVELQNLEYLTLINTLHSTVENLHNKIDNQKENEKNLITSSSKFKEIINNVNKNLNSFHEYENQTKLKAQDLVQSIITPTIAQIVNILKGSNSSNFKINNEIESVQQDFETIVNDHQILVSNACKNVSESIVSKLPTLFEDIENKLKSMNNIELFISNLNEKFSKLSQENNNLKIMLNENLFNNHQEIVENAINYTKKQFEIEQKETFDKVFKILNESTLKQNELISNQIKATVQDVVGIEKSNLNPIKNEWNESTRKVINSLDKENMKFSNNHQNELSIIFSKLKESNNFANNSTKIIENELSKVVSLSKDINEKVKYKNSLKQIENKFNKSQEYKDELINLLKNTESNISKTKEIIDYKMIKESSKTDLKSDDVNKLIKEIEEEQVVIKKSLLPTGKTPKRGIFKLPVNLTLNETNENTLNQSPPKFQLIGQRFDFIKNNESLEKEIENKENVANSNNNKRRNLETISRPRKIVRRR